MGDPQPHLFPTVIEQEGIDIIYRGEAEDALVELLDRLQNGQDYTDVKNLWIKQGDRIIKNPMRPLIQDLDSLPFPDRGSFLKYYAYAHSSVKHFLATLGCPYDCAYCFNHMLKRIYKEMRRTPNAILFHFPGSPALSYLTLHGSGRKMCLYSDRA